jgi:integrase
VNVKKRSEGKKKWLARVSWQVGGKQVQKGKRFATQAEAVRWAREEETKLDRGIMIRPAKISLDEYLDGWLASMMEANQRTKEHYGAMLSRYIRPKLGSVRLDQLTTHAIRSVLAGLSAKGLSPRTVNYARAVLRLALNRAVEDGLLAVNPAVARGMVPPRVHREQRVLSREQVRTLLDTSRDTRWGALWSVLVYTGMRPGEALGLKWDDLNLNAGTAQIRRALVPQRKDASGRVWRVEDTKTAGSRRMIRLLAATVDALKRHRDEQGVERLVAGEGYQDHGFVFATERGEPLRGDVVYRNHFLKALRKAGLPEITLYGLRHTAATLLLEAGVPMRAVSEQLGHSTMTLTADTYSHVSAQLQEQAIKRLATYMELPSSA